VTYAGGVISWSEGRVACAYAVRTRRTGCWDPTVRQESSVQQGVGPDPLTHMPVSHTAHGLFITFPWGKGSGQITYYVSLARLLQG
jgi:hypothetical protein